MRSISIRVCMIICVLVLWSVVARANPTPPTGFLPDGTTIVITQGPLSYGNGGLFYISTGNGLNFVSFCIEELETFYPGRTYYANLSADANHGGTQTTDPVGAMTGLLYRTYMNGLLGTYVPGFNNSAAANGALQNAIWYIEEEVTALQSGLATDLYSWALATDTYHLSASTDHAWEYGVWAINVWENSNLTGNSQDQLFLVPEPAMPILLGIGMGVIALLPMRMKA